MKARTLNGYRASNPVRRRLRVAAGDLTPLISDTIIPEFAETAAGELWPQCPNATPF